MFAFELAVAFVAFVICSTEVSNTNAGYNISYGRPVMLVTPALEGGSGRVRLGRWLIFLRNDGRAESSYVKKGYFSAVGFGW